MILSLAAVLGPEALARITEAGDAGHITSHLREGICANPRFRRAVQPLRFGTAEVLLIDSRAPSSKSLETPLMTLAVDGQPLRADVEVICFLADPDSYAGGEVVIDTGYGGVAHKDAAGSCVVCPTASRRWLSPVTAGTSRIARIAVQSIVRDVEQRTILYDLVTAADFFNLAGLTEPVLTLHRCRDRLLGLWTEV